jgi:hypothetical protein
VLKLLFIHFSQPQKISLKEEILRINEEANLRDQRERETEEMKRSKK